MFQKPAVIRALSAIVAASAISLSTAHFLPAHHPINRVVGAIAQEEEFEDEIEEELEEEIDDEIEDDLDDEIDEDFEDEFEADFEEHLEEALEDEFDEEDELDDDEEEDFEEEDDEEDEDDDGGEEEDDEQVSRQFELELDDDGDAIAANELLILGSADDIDAIIAAGLETDSVSDLASLDLKLVRVSTRGPSSLEALRTQIAVLAPDAEIDVNHLYREQSAPEEIGGSQIESQPYRVAPLSKRDGLRIGLIDTRLDQTNDALAKSRVIARDFVQYDAKRPVAHGTAIASILVGESERFVGLLPNAELYAASVFFETPSGSSTATTESLVASLDWLNASHVQVINMSLSGPPNAILERAVERVQAHGVSVIAAVGNDGPAAPPRYPAAYPGVIGVTAISAQKTVFRHAGRGNHIDFSAFGVGVQHAGGPDGITVSSGTSFAAPYVAAQFAIAGHALAPEYLFDAFVFNAEDLGPVGYDPIYGHGLLRSLDQFQTAGETMPASLKQD